MRFKIFRKVPMTVFVTVASDPAVGGLPGRARLLLRRGREGRVKSPGASLARRARPLLSDPSDGASAFWAGGVPAVLGAAALGSWSGGVMLVLVAVAGVCATIAGARMLVGRRLPGWTLHVDAALGTALTSVLAVVGAPGHVNFADLYIWVVLFAALYLPPAGALAHMSVVGAAYAVVLALGPRQPEPVLAWLAVCGTAFVPGMVVLGLVSVLRSTARRDPLTGLANRRAWDERLEEELARSLRTGQALSIAVLDLDGFKAINDQSGHDAGDRVLQDLARRWSSEVRDGGDFLARLGGDEFGLIAPGSAMTDIRRLVKRVSGVAPDRISVSTGVATWDGREHARKLVRRADQAMYRRKRARHKSVSAVPVDMTELLCERLRA